MTIGSIPHYLASNGAIYTAVQKPGQDERDDHLHERAASEGSAIHGLASASGAVGKASESAYEDVELQGASAGLGDYETVGVAERPLSMRAHQDQAMKDFLTSSVARAWANPNDGKRGVHLEQFTKDLIKAFCADYPAGPAKFIAPAFAYGAGKACHQAVWLAEGARHREMFKSLQLDAAEANRTSGVHKDVAQMLVLNEALKSAFVELPQAVQDKWLKRATAGNVADCGGRMRLDERGQGHPGDMTLSVLLSVANEARRQSPGS